MVKNILLLFFLVCSTGLRCQEIIPVPTQKKKSAVFTSAGLEIGSGLHSGIAGYYFDTQLNYFVAYKSFALKLRGGITPISNFGVIQDYFIGLGYTTPASKTFSFHALMGLCKSVGEMPYYTYTYGGLGPGLEVGVSLRSKNHKKIFYGLNTTLTPLLLKEGNRSITSMNITFYLSLNYVISE